MLLYNLQFFAEDNDGENNVDNPSGDIDNGDTTKDNEVDTVAFAELLSERDKKIEQLEKELITLKKSNAELIVKVSSSTQPQAKSFEENLLSLVGAKPRKEK